MSFLLNMIINMYWLKGIMVLLMFPWSDPVSSTSTRHDILYNMAKVHEALERGDMGHLGTLIGTEFAELGCTNIYIDMGTNTGVQILKWFWIKDFPKSKVFDIFSKETSSGKSCAVGFEANPRYENHLMDVSMILWHLGHVSFIFSPLGVSTGDGTLVFHDIKNRYQYQGSGFYRGESNSGHKGKLYNVTTIDISKFILDVAYTMTRLNPLPYRIIVKSDIEGEEYNVIPAMVRPHKIMMMRDIGLSIPLISPIPVCNIDMLLIEWHRHAPSSNISEPINSKWVSKTVAQMQLEGGINKCRNTRIESMDDEKYGTMNVRKYLDDKMELYDRKTRK
jgi:hypothetical protein